jgi:hypothetical protein
MQSLTISCYFLTLKIPKSRRLIKKKSFSLTLLVRMMGED